MDTFLKTCAGVLITLVLTLLLSRKGGDISLLLSIASCAMVATSAISLLNPVLKFFRTLESIGNLDKDLLEVIIKCTGIGILGEIASTICNDAGATALGKTLQMLSAAVIICMSIPLFEMLLELIQEILVAV